MHEIQVYMLHKKIHELFVYISDIDIHRISVYNIVTG